MIIAYYRTLLTDTKDGHILLDNVPDEIRKRMEKHSPSPPRVHEPEGITNFDDYQRKHAYRFLLRLAKTPGDFLHHIELWVLPTVVLSLS